MLCGHPRCRARDVKGIGYTDASYGFDYETCGVITSIKEQSCDIALGVDKAQEAKCGEMSDAEIEAVGAGDQGMMFGYACTERRRTDAYAHRTGARPG
jgi:S-adenosylmethionine synthetase